MEQRSTSPDEVTSLEIPSPRSSPILSPSSPTIPLENKRMRSYLNKITERNFPKISDEMLTVVLLSNPDSFDSQENDREIMLPITQNFISNVCVFERNDEAMIIYVKAFCKLKEKWIGRHGKVFFEVTMSEIHKNFVDYKNLMEMEDLDEDSAEFRKSRNNCLKLCRFMSLLYSEGAIGLKLILAILQTFVNDRKHSVEVFCKLFGYALEKLNTEEIFRLKVLQKYKTHLQEMTRKYETECFYKFLCLEILDKI